MDTPVNEAPVAANVETTEPIGQENSGVVTTVESGESGTDGEPAGTQDKAKKTGGDDETPLWAKKRFAELTKARTEAQREAQQLREELYQIQQKVNVEPPKTRDDFLDEADYHRHLAREEIRVQQQQQYAADLQYRQQQDAVRQKTQSWAEKVKTTLTELPDYQEVVSAAVDVPLDAETRDFIVESTIGPKIAYWLSKNPEKALALGDLTPKAKERELLKIELRLETQNLGGKPVTPVSQAPKPVASVNGTGSGGTATPPKSMSDEEWIKWRQKQVRGR